MKKLLLLIILFIPANTFAEPSKSVAYLMQEPFSLFEWGLYKLEDNLKEVEFEDLNLVFRTLPRVDYDWDKNIIDVTLTIYPSYSGISKDGPKKICRSAQTSIKSHYGQNLPKEFRSIFGIKQFFKHKGYAKKDEPETLMDDLETMTQITVQIYASKTDKPTFNEQCSCTSRILENEIFFRDTEIQPTP